MLVKTYLQPGIALRMLIGSCMALILGFFLFPRSAAAYAPSLALDGPTFQVSMGFDSRYQDGNWVPVQITLHNTSTDFNGAISVRVPTPFSGGFPTYAANYQVPISLANGSQKQITLYIPLNTGGQGSTQNITVNLLDTSGSVVRSQIGTLRALGANDVMIGTLSDQSTGFSSLSGISLPSQGNSLIVQPLSANTFPAVAAVLRNFDAIVVDNFTTSTLSQDQLTALQIWVNQGGTLIEAGGPEWKRTLSPLPPSLLPVTIDTTTTLPAGTTLLPVGISHGESKAKVSAPITISVGSITAAADTGPNFSILAAGNTPLIVQVQRGEGNIFYLAFDPTLDPVVGWQGMGLLWKSLLLRGLGDQALASNPNQYYGPGKGKILYPQSGMDGLLQDLMPNTIPSPWLLLALLGGYLVILGPLRFLIVRWRKRRDWSWRIALSSIIIFSLLAYGLALYQKGTAIASNTISVIRLNQGNSSAHVTTYVGVFIPNQGTFQVHIPGRGLVQPSSGGFQDVSNGSNGAPPATITPGQNATDVTLQSQAFWAVRSIVTEQDQQIQGGITSDLTVQNATLTGTVTNNLHYALSDVYALVAHNFVPLGNMAPGVTKKVNLPLSNALAGPGGQSLADQIASSNGLPTPYGPYSTGSLPQNENQRHIAILSALSGEGYGVVYYGGPGCGPGPCTAVGPAVKVVSSSTIIYSGGGPGIVNSHDPLLISGSPATLIGWASQSANAPLSINGVNSTGIHETLVEAPLSAGLAGAVNLPSGFVQGQIIDVQNTDSSIQVQSPNIYSMMVGSMTFEFAVPGVANFQIGNLVISEPANLNQFINAGGPSGQTVDVTSLNLQLYNWQSHSWDTITLDNQLTFSTSNAASYIGPGGRVLLQLSNTKSSNSTAVFARPYLSLQGTVTP